MTETTKQNLSIFFITILIAISIFIFSYFIKPAMAERRDLLTKINETREKIKILQDYQSKFQILVQNYQNLGDKIDMINQSLPNDAQTAQVLAILDNIAKQKGIVFQTLTFNTQVKELYNVLDIKIIFNATYDNFKIWISEIEKELRLLDLTKITIQSKLSDSSINIPAKKKTKTLSPALEFNINLSAYFQK